MSFTNSQYLTKIIEKRCYRSKLMIQIRSPHKNSYGKMEYSFQSNILFKIKVINFGMSGTYLQ